MTDNVPISPYDDEPGQHARRRRSTWPLWAGAIGVFIGGLVAGGAVVTVSGISSDNTVRVIPSPSASPSPVNGILELGGGPQEQGTVALGPGCVRAIDQVNTVYEDLTALGNAASNFDVGTLDDIVRQLQDMRPALQRNLADCHATVQLPGATPSPSPAG